MLALVIFAAGLALSGGAPSTIPLIVGRSLAGIGGNGISQGLMLIMIPMIPLHKRRAYQGAFGATFAVGNVTGHVLGGVLTSFVSWRWCFLIT